MKSITPLTHLGFLVNWICDKRPPTDLSFSDIHAAASVGPDLSKSE